MEKPVYHKKCPYCGIEFDTEIQWKVFCRYLHRQIYNNLKKLSSDRAYKLSNHDYAVWLELHNNLDPKILSELDKKREAYFDFRKKVRD